MTKMSEACNSFGRSVATVDTPEAVLTLEAQRAQTFATMDALFGSIVTRALQGELIVSTLWADKQSFKATLNGLPPASQEWLGEQFGAESQKSRGFWQLPERNYLRLGYVHLPYHLRNHGRFAFSIASTQVYPTLLSASPDAVFVWALVEPLFYALFRPFHIALTMSESLRDQQKLELEQLGSLSRWLGLPDEQYRDAMRTGSEGYASCAANHAHARTAFLQVLATLDGAVIARRYRAHLLHGLVRRYYSVVTKNGTVQRKRVLIKPYDRALVGLFGGDWLAFLDYLEERPHATERIVTGLPETRFLVAGNERAAEIAARKGMPLEVVERVLASFWGGTEGSSPVASRLACLRRYWDVFQEIHRCQVRGMPSLWGLVTEYSSFSISRCPPRPDGEGPFPDLPKRVLPADLVGDIERLWATRVDRRWPEKLITEPFPHLAMAEAFGPALEFWHGCALTVWFLCEGPGSRTDFVGLEAYYTRSLQAMKALGTPVDPLLFSELIRAGDKVLRDWRGGSSVPFEELRPIIDRHRAAWTASSLPSYLQALWKGHLGEVDRDYNLQSIEQGKPPTLKKLGKAPAVAAANQWFAGDLGKLLAAIGKKAVREVTYQRCVPIDADSFVSRVYASLLRRRKVEPQYEGYIARIAEESVKYLQFQEGARRTPTLRDLKWYPSYAEPLCNDSDQAWALFVAAIEEALHETAPVRP